MPSSTYFSGGASDWTEHIKDYSTTQNGISLWDQVLTGLQQNLELQTQAVQASTDYDISQAYANYLQNQRQISQASNLRSGFKEQLESNLQSSYHSAFQQAQVNETQELYNVAQAYQDELTNVENQFAERGETAARYAGELFEYAGQYGKYVPGYEDIDWSGDLQAQGIYVPDDQDNLVLSEKGKNVLNYLLLNRVSIPGKTESDATSTSFEQWLGETYPDDLSGYREYADIIRTGFGIEPGKTSFNQEQFEQTYEDLYTTETIDKVQNISNKYTNSAAADSYSSNFTSFKQELSYDVSNILDIDESNISIYNMTGISATKNSTIQIIIKTDDLNDLAKNVLLNSGGKEDGNKIRITLAAKGNEYTTYEQFFKDLANKNYYTEQLIVPGLNQPTSGGAGGGGVGRF